MFFEDEIVVFSDEEIVEGEEDDLLLDFGGGFVISIKKTDYERTEEGIKVPRKKVENTIPIKWFLPNCEIYGES